MTRLVIWHRLLRHTVHTRRHTGPLGFITRHWCVDCDTDWTHTYR